MGVKNVANDKVKLNIKNYPKYDDYNYPVILLDSGLDVIYKNNAARFVNIKPRIGMNIKKYTDARNFEKLQEAFNDEMINAVVLNVKSCVKYCTARREKAEKYKEFEELEEEQDILVLIFFDSLNLLRNENEMIDKIGTVINKYNEQEIKLIESISSHSLNNINSANNTTDAVDVNIAGRLNRAKDIYSEEYALGFAEDVEYIENMENMENVENVEKSAEPGHKYHENNKKILRVREHFRRHILNLKTDAADIYKSYCDIGAFMRSYENGILPSINNLGYKINFNTEDKMFLYRLNERDFLTVNFILASIAFEYSVFNKINVRFFKNNDKFNVLRYEFSVPRDFARTHSDMLSGNNLENIEKIEYMDLVLSDLIAQNNDMRLDMRFNEDNGSKVYMDLIFLIKGEVCMSPSPLTERCINFITAEYVREKAEIELSILKYT